MRTIKDIAHDITQDWSKPYFGAVPYLDAMLTLTDKSSRYYYDSAESVVIYFLSNAATYRGEKARLYKSELKAIIKS